MPDRIIVTSYAKVNYTLDVLSRRADGFHNIASVIQTVSLADTITLTRESQPGIRLECNAPGVPADSTNLCWRAAAALFELSRVKAGVHIHLQKRVPSQAGLGGGSSNAACTLMGINALFGLNLTATELQSPAADLGSDVPFFLAGGTASMRGRGERITPLQDGPPFWFIIVKPPASVSTGWAYGALDALRDRTSARSTRSMEAILANGDVPRIVSRMTNDFEQVVCAEVSPIAEAMDDMMMARARSARLCGSGAAVFGLAFSQAEADAVARSMRLKYSEVHVCRAASRAEAMAPGGAGDA